MCACYLLLARRPGFYIVLEDINILFGDEICAFELSRVLLKVFTHCHTPERLSTVHATFCGRHKRRFPFKLTDCQQ